MEPISISRMTEDVQERLLGIGLSPEQTRAECDWFIEAATGLTASQRLANGHAPISREAVSRLASWLDSRIEDRTPIQYVLGHAWFYGMKLTVTSDVLIPRPESELLVEEALAFCRKRYKECKKPVRVVDVCTGSGAIALAIKHTLGDEADVSAADISEDAVAIAQKNAASLGIAVNFLAGDLLTPFADQKFDLIVANPPYVDLAGATSLTREVVDHEPHVALFAPGHRISLHMKLIEEAPNFLVPEGGALGLEIGYGLGEEVSGLFNQAGYQGVRVMNDFAGIDRLVWGDWPGH